MSPTGDIAGGRQEACLFQRNFRTSPRTGGVQAGMPAPGTAIADRSPSVHGDLPRHEPCARRGSESPEEILQPFLASYFASNPDAAVHVRLERQPHAGTKAASWAA